MQLAVWWTFKRCQWAILPLPRHPNDRDPVVANRAALVLDRHLREIPNGSYKLDPYATKSPKFLADSPKAEAILMAAVERTKKVLRRHSMPGHLMNALLRERDPETIQRSKEAAEQVAREAAEEKSRRASPTIPPPASGSTIEIGGKSGTP